MTTETAPAAFVTNSPSLPALQAGLGRAIAARATLGMRGSQHHQ